MDDGRVVFETSLDGANEDQNNTQDDAVKLIRIIIKELEIRGSFVFIK
jgi:hypothetical protein